MKCLFSVLRINVFSLSRISPNVLLTCVRYDAAVCGRVDPADHCSWCWQSLAVDRLASDRTDTRPSSPQELVSRVSNLPVLGWKIYNFPHFYLLVHLVG